MATEKDDFISFNSKLVGQWWEFRLYYNGESKKISRIHRSMVDNDAAREIYQKAMVELLTMNVDEMTDYECKITMEKTH